MPGITMDTAAIHPPRASFIARPKENSVCAAVSTVSERSRKNITTITAKEIINGIIFTGLKLCSDVHSFHIIGRLPTTIPISVRRVGTG